MDVIIFNSAAYYSIMLHNIQSMIFSTAECQEGSNQDPEKLWRGDHSGRRQPGPGVLVPAAVRWVSLVCLLILHRQMGRQTGN